MLLMTYWDLTGSISVRSRFSAFFFFMGVHGMNFLTDFTNMPQSNLLYGGNAGLKRGIIWNNKQWLIKFPQETASFENVDISFTTSPLSEYVGSHIFEMLGYNVHRTELGIFNNEKINRRQLVVACQDFTDNGRLKLIDYETIKNNYSDELQIQLSELKQSLPEYKSKGISSHTVPIEEIILQFEENDIFVLNKKSKKLFWEILIIDCLINNNDRNKNNWGFLFDSNSGKYIVAPIYDNGASFVSKHSDEKLQKLLSNDSALVNSALNGMCYYTVDNELVNFSNFFKKLKNKRLDNDLKEALQVVIPNVDNKWGKIESFINSIPNEENGTKIMSGIQKEFFIKTMKIRFEQLIKRIMFE